LKSPAGQAGIAGELREVMHRNPPLTKTRMAVAPIHSLASTLGRAFAVFEKEVFLERFWGRDGPPARGAFPRRSGPKQAPNPPGATRSPGGAGLVKRASALATSACLCCRVASQHLLTTRLGPQHPPRTRLPRVCQLLNAREDKQCHFCPGPHRTNNLHDLMFGRIRGIVQRDVAQLSVISLPLLPPCPAPARDSIIRARLLLFSQERAWAAHQDRVRVDYA